MNLLSVSGDDAESFYFPGYPAFFIRSPKSNTRFDISTIQEKYPIQTVNIETEQGIISVPPSTYPVLDERIQPNLPIPKIVTKNLQINQQSLTKNKKLIGKTIFRRRKDSPITRPISRKIVKRDAEALDLPKAFGWAPLETTSKQIMKLLKGRNLPMMPFNSQKLLQKRRTVAKSEKYPKVRRQPAVEQGVEYETMLPLGYEEYESRQESREPPPVNVDENIFTRDHAFPNINNQYSEDNNDEPDYEDFAEQLKTHYLDKKQPDLNKSPTDKKTPTITHYHEQAHIQRYPNMQRQKVRVQKKVKRKINTQPRPFPKRRIEKAPPRLHQRLKHPANRKRPFKAPLTQQRQPSTTPPPPVVDPPKAEQQFQEIQQSLPDESLLPTIYEPTSLQSILATHKIHTNVLRTRPRTQNVAYHALGEDLAPLETDRRDDGDLVSPYYYSKDGQWEEVYPKTPKPRTPMTLSKYQTMIDESKKEQAEEERRQYYVRQQIERLQQEIEEERARNEELKRSNELSKRIDSAQAKEEKEIEEVKPITKSLAETAILALNLGDKLLQLYESVEPYVTNG